MKYRAPLTPRGRGAPCRLQGRAKPGSAHRLLQATATLCLVPDARLEDSRKGRKGSAGYPFPGLWLGREGFSLDYLWSVLIGTAGLWASPVPKAGDTTWEGGKKPIPTTRQLAAGFLGVACPLFSTFIVFS